MASSTTALRRRRRRRRPSGSPPIGDRYRLVAFSPSVHELVAAAGGMLFDRAAAGWEVVVFVDTDSGYRPLEVLGVSAVRSFGQLARDVEVPSADMVVASAALHGDLLIQRYISNACKRSGEVGVWGGSWPCRTGEWSGLLEYAVSHAGGVFKQQALLAANRLEPLPVATVEAFRRIRSPSARGLTTVAARNA